jgi:hypothetical protein
MGYRVQKFVNIARVRGPANFWLKPISLRQIMSDNFPGKDVTEGNPDNNCRSRKGMETMGRIKSPTTYYSADCSLGIQPIFRNERDLPRSTLRSFGHRKHKKKKQQEKTFNTKVAKDAEREPESLNIGTSLPPEFFADFALNGLAMNFVLSLPFVVKFNSDRGSATKSTKNAKIKPDRNKLN